MTDIRQSKNFADYLRSQGWTVESLPAQAGIDNINYFIRKLPIVGSVLKVQRPAKIDFKTIQKLEKKYRVFQTIIESDLTSVVNSFSNIHSLLLHNGYKLSKSPFLPSKTLHLDLTKPLKFNKETRRAIRKGPFFAEATKGREVFNIKQYSTPDEIKKFHEAWKKSVNFSRYVPSLKSLLSLRKAFPNNTSIFLASHNLTSLKLRGTSISAGAIFIRTRNIGYYWQAFTNKEGRTSLSQYSLLYSGILWAKRNNCKVFDFEGIYDNRFPNKSWLGFTHFKKSFGGTEVLYPGCYTKFCLNNIFLHFR